MVIPMTTENKVKPPKKVYFFFKYLQAFFFFILMKTIVNIILFLHQTFKNKLLEVFITIPLNFL